MRSQIRGQTSKLNGGKLEHSHFWKVKCDIWESARVKCSVHGQMKEANTAFRWASRALPNLFFTARYSQKYKEAPTGRRAETVTRDMLLFRNPQWKSSVRNKSGSAASGRREEVGERWAGGCWGGKGRGGDANCRSHTLNSASHRHGGAPCFHEEEPFFCCSS